MERWRLAVHVLSIPHGLQYTKLSEIGAPLTLNSTITTFTLTTPDDRILSDKLEIYKCLSGAAVTSAAWMSRLSDEDLLWHIGRADELGDAVGDLYQANTESGYRSALAKVSGALQRLEENSDLSRFVRKYRKASDGTHFLDAFYAPLLLRIYAANQYYATSEVPSPIINLEKQFPVMAMWTAKVVGWGLLLHVVLGADFASSVVVFARDRGSYLFNNLAGPASEPVDESALLLRSKGMPAVFLRNLRLSVVTAQLCGASSVDKSGGDKRNDALALCDAVLRAEQDCLTRRCGVILRLKDLEAAREAVTAPSGLSDGDWAAFLAKWNNCVEVAFGIPVKKHLMDHFSLHDLWLLEMDILMHLSRSSALQLWVLGFLETTPLGDKVQFVQCLVQMVTLSLYLTSDASLMERALIDVLQCIYRECSPSDWADIAFRVSSVNGLVVTKENWYMHYKFPVVTLLSSMYNVIKALVMEVHALICPVPPSTASDSEASSEASFSENLPLVSPTQTARLLERIVVWVSMLSPAITSQYAPILADLEGGGRSYIDAGDIAEWEAQLASFHTNVEALLRMVVIAAGVEDRARKKLRFAWRKLKKDLVLLLRDQKKLLLPTLLRFATGERLEEAQSAFVTSISQDLARWDTVTEELVKYALPRETVILFNWLRFVKPALYMRLLTPQVLEQHQHNRASVWYALQPLQVCGDEEQAWLRDPTHWPLHPKFAGVPFILGLSNRVLLDDLTTCARAVQRALRGLGVLPTADVRDTFEILYAHYLSHREIIYKFVVTHLAKDDAERAQDLKAGNLEDYISKLERDLTKAEANEEGRRQLLESALVHAEALVAEASRSLGAFSSKYVPRCVLGFTYLQSMELFAKIVNMYHRGNPHLLSRTVEALHVDEYPLFCRNMLSLPFALLRDVLEGLRSEIPTRLWLRLVECMPCLGGVTLDSVHWQLHPRFGGMPLFWQMSHRYIEEHLTRVLALVSASTMTLETFTSMLDATQNLMQHVEKHGTFEDAFVLPRIASAVPFVAEATFDDANNEHSLLEMNELRAIQILKTSYKALKTDPGMVPAKQVNRMKRQVRSYQTLILPHLAKEEEKFMPVMLNRFTPAQWVIMQIHMFDLYGELLSDEYVVDLLSLAPARDQRLLLLHFLPFFVLRQREPTYFIHHSMWQRVAIVEAMKDVVQAAEFIRQKAPKLWMLCSKANLFAFLAEDEAAAKRK